MLGSQLGRSHVFATDFTFGKVVLVVADTPHVLAVSQLRGEAITNHQFGTTTPDIDNQLLAVVWLGMGDTKINKAGFFGAGDDFNRIGDQGFRAFEEDMGIVCLP